MYTVKHYSDIIFDTLTVRNDKFIQVPAARNNTGSALMCHSRRILPPIPANFTSVITPVHITEEFLLTVAREEKCVFFFAGAPTSVLTWEVKWRYWY